MILAPIKKALATARALLLDRRDEEAEVLLESSNKAVAVALAVVEPNFARRPNERDWIVLRDLRAVQRAILQAKLVLSMTGNRFHARTPPRPGSLLRIPLLATGAGTVPAGRSFDTFSPAVGQITLQTQNLPWFKYKLEGILIQRAVTVGSLLDNVVAQELRWSGGTSTLMTEVSADTMRAGNTQWIGLRYKPTITDSKNLTLTLQAFSAGNAAPAGTSLVSAMAIITVLEDYPQESMVPSPETSFVPTLGYVESGPSPGNLMRVAFAVEAADALNAVGAVGVRLSAAVPQVQLVSRNVTWDDYQIVGLETVTPVRTVTTDFATVANLRGSNGIDLLGEVGDLPIEAFLLNETDRGGGSNKLAGLRKHQVISSPGRVRLTLRGWDGATGNAGPAATMLLNGINLIVNRTHRELSYGMISTIPSLPLPPEYS